MSPIPSQLNLDETGITIIGVGLIGGSIAAALRARGYAGHILGVGRNASRLDAARERGLIDGGFTNGAAAADSSLVISCLPVERVAASLISAAETCRADAILTDAGSVKTPICTALRGRIGENAAFIGSHPLAGSHHQGFEHADPELFADRVCVITPFGDDPPRLIERLTRFWEYIGSTVVQLSVEDHDRILARTSHLPHVVSSMLASLLEPDDDRFAASGFRDTTRIAAADSQLWTDILQQNRSAVLAELKGFSNALDRFEAALASGDASRIIELLAAGRKNRERLD